MVDRRSNYTSYISYTCYTSDTTYATIPTRNNTRLEYNTFTLEYNT